MLKGFFKQVMDALSQEASGKTVRNYWIGRDPDDRRIVWTVRNTSGANWKLLRNNEDMGTFTTAAVNDDFIELDGKSLRIRLSDTKMTIAEADEDWTVMAAGRWRSVE